jgi:hypothetical protein
VNHQLPCPLAGIGDEFLEAHRTTSSHRRCTNPTSLIWAPPQRHRHHQAALSGHGRQPGSAASSRSTDLHDAQRGGQHLLGREHVGRSVSSGSTAVVHTRHLTREPSLLPCFPRRTPRPPKSDRLLVPRGKGGRAAGGCRRHGSLAGSSRSVPCPVLSTPPPPLSPTPMPRKEPMRTPPLPRQAAGVERRLRPADNNVIAMLVGRGDGRRRNRVPLQWEQGRRAQPREVENFLRATASTSTSLGFARRPARQHDAEEAAACPPPRRCQ